MSTGVAAKASILIVAGELPAPVTLTSASPVQLLNAYFAISAILPEIFTPLMALQLEKADSPMFVRVSGNSSFSVLPFTFNKETQPLKAYLFIAVRPEGNFKVSRAIHAAKALSSITLTPSEIVTVLRASQP